MNKLTALIEAAKADCIAREGNYGELCGYGDDILELCALLEKAEESMEAFTDPEGDMPADTGEFRDLAKALAAIKQWKDQT